MASGVTQHVGPEYPSTTKKKKKEILTYSTFDTEENIHIKNRKVSAWVGYNSSNGPNRHTRLFTE
jgi:hypothetical protein